MYCLMQSDFSYTLNQYHAKEYISITNHESLQTSTGTKQTLFKLEGAPCLVTLALLLEEGNSLVYFEGTYQTEMLPEMSRTKPAQGQKYTSFELQSVFCFFVPVQVWRTLKFKTFVFFVPVQVWCTLKFKTCVFLSLCRFGAL